MTEVVWFPPLRQTKEGDQAIADWCTSQGIDAYGVARTGFRVERSADGTLTAKYFEFLKLEDGARYRSDSADDGWAKTYVERAVTSLPPVHCITGKVHTPEV